VRFRTLAYGKPAVDGDTVIRFNLSHSGDLALCAITGEREIGVDIEQIRPDLDWESLARRFFSAEEVAARLRSILSGEWKALFAAGRAKRRISKRGGKVFHFLSTRSPFCLRLIDPSQNAGRSSI
jgi:Phosphopantetheinyl transferase